MDDKGSNSKTLDLGAALGRHIEPFRKTTTLYRCVQLRYGASLHYDARPAEARWNVKQGTAYMADTWDAAIGETLLHGPSADFRFVSRDALNKRGMLELLPRRPLRVVRLHGKTLAKLGLDARFTSQLDYGETCAFAQSVFDHHPQADGIVWRSRVNNDLRNFAIFKRVDLSFAINDLGPLDSPKNFPRVRAIVHDYGYVIRP